MAAGIVLIITGGNMCRNDGWNNDDDDDAAVEQPKAFFVEIKEVGVEGTTKPSTGAAARAGGVVTASVVAGFF